MTLNEMLCGKCCHTLREKMGGSAVYIPKRDVLNPKDVFNLRKKRMTVNQIAAKYGVTERRVYQILHR